MQYTKNEEVKNVDRSQYSHFENWLFKLRRKNSLFDFLYHAVDGGDSDFELFRYQLDVIIVSVKV
jgi:hypothetical protein